MGKRIIDNRCLYVTFILFGFNLNISALEYNYSIDAGYEDSDNLSQLVEGEAGQAFDFGLGFNLSNSLQKEWELDLTGQFSKVEYSEVDLGNETNTDITGSAIYQSSTSNFSFTSLVDITQAPINRFQTQEVNNTRDQLVYAVTPSYYFAINSADRINTSYSFIDFNIESINGEQASLLGQAQSSTDQNLTVNYQKRINATNALALNARSGKIDFDEGIVQGAIDYNRVDYFISWNVAGRTDQLRVELGRSEIRDQLSREQQMDHQLVNYTRQLNSANSFSLAYSDGVNNPLSTVQATGQITVNQQNNNITAAQVIKQTSLAYTFSGDLLSTNINFSDAEVSQSFTQNIENRQLFTANMNYVLSRIINNSGLSNIALNYSKSESNFDSQFTNIQFNDIETYGITYNYVHSSKLAFALSYNVRETLRTTISNDQTIADSNSVSFTVTYRNDGRF